MKKKRFYKNVKRNVKWTEEEKGYPIDFADKYVSDEGIYSDKFDYMRPKIKKKRKHKAQARTLFMRIFILNDLMDCPDMGDAACFRRHLGALRRNLGALMKNRERVWLPPSRKAYALVLCACPGAARLLHRRRVEKRRRKG